jgi:hypothetical protein
VLDTEASGEGLGLLVDRVETWSGHWLAGDLPGWTGAEGENAIYQSRYLSDGGRLFFNSPVALVPADKNTKNDVYEYEPVGVGTCADESGCISLISSGTSERESAFLDASVSGNDVFFLTAQPLVASDHDTSLDVYDARDCSQAPCITPPSEVKVQCASEAECKTAVTSQPALVAPAATVSTVGNLPTAHQIPVTGVPPSKPKAKAPTRAQRLAKALKACKRDKSKHKRAQCERAAKKAYGPKRAHKSSRGAATGAKR